MNFLPIFLDLRGRTCLVVGGGETAARKAGLLLQAGAWIRLVHEGDLASGFAEHKEHDRITHVRADFTDAALEGVELVISAAEDDVIDKQVYDAARSRHIPVNVVDKPAMCSFVLPAILDRSPMIVAVGTGGASPVLARLLRARLETLIPASYGRLAQLAESFREKVKDKFSSPPMRRIFWEKVLQGPVAEMVFSGKEDDAAKLLQHTLDMEANAQPVGEVYLVGAGPGNPDLLTFRALRLMQQADVVVHDNLVSEPIMDMCRRDAERIYVGKQRANHAVPQEDINMLLVRLAKEGKRVLRLKGGDPFIFGRGGEEIETLVDHGVPFQVVPGITAAAGVASYAGIPLTHRDYAQSVTFVTGHLKDDTINLDWSSIAKPNQTIVIYMGLQGLPVLSKELVRHGLSPQTPAAIVQQGTTPHQRVVTGTLETLPMLAVEAQLKPPTLIIVGNVVSLHEKLKWFVSEDDRAASQK
ncbi:MAG: uroporphyrinogen-III C-methyltransferase [Hydrogenophilaceae bacterium]|nr:uroporphyrinogen-III C-methyltransferase [Hydrogenophilaceae bacterium]